MVPKNTKATLDNTNLLRSVVFLQALLDNIDLLIHCELFEIVSI